jgi:tRNA A-37 threonylcarbamoyl transferase component Bud32
MILRFALLAAALVSAQTPSVLEQATESEKKPELAWSRLDPYIERFREHKDKVEDIWSQLTELQKIYPTAEDLDAVAGQRERLRGLLGEEVHQIDSVEDEYKNVLKSIEMLAITAGFSRAMNKKDFAGADKDLHKAIYFDDMKNEMRHLKKKIRQGLNNDAVEWDAAMNRRTEKKRVWVAAATAAAFIVVTAFVAIGLSRRKQEFPTQPITAEVTQTPPSGALSGPRAPLALGGPESGPAGAPLSSPSGGPVSGPAGVPITAASSDGLAPGTVLHDNFEITKELGKGGMGEVFEAKDLTLARPVAIKRMREEIVSSKKELDMFLSEARLVASLKHLNLVEIYSIFREGGQLYLVFELVTGKSLYDLMEDGEPLPYETVKNVVRQAAEGLDYAHSQKVIHRDLKPSNIMITPDDIVKIMDFGLAHQAKKTVAKLTKADAWGTPPYMAPEQELGTVSRESDLYSLAVLYYEMVTGEIPFQGPNFLAQKREKVYKPPSEVVSGVPARVDKIVSKALEPVAADRYHSAKEFADDVSGVSFG